MGQKVLGIASAFSDVSAFVWSASRWAVSWISSFFSIL
jgi:hypothetical protein